MKVMFLDHVIKCYTKLAEGDVAAIAIKCAHGQWGAGLHLLLLDCGLIWMH